jgi:tetratricopeptide (TPR) repeat protein
MASASEQLRSEIDLTRRIVLCSALFKARVWDQLAACADSLVEDAPARAEGHFYRGLALVHTGHEEDGLAELREAVRLDPASPSFSDTLAVIVSDRESRRLAGILDAALRAGELDQAAELARHLTHVAPRSSAGYLALAAVHVARGELREALGSATEALPANPEDEAAAAVVQDLLARTLRS